jgi:hypothetical protein
LIAGMSFLSLMSEQPSMPQLTHVLSIVITCLIH